MDVSEIRERIEELVAEEHRLLAERAEGELAQERHERLEKLKEELDATWDLLRRREAGMPEGLSDEDVPDPPNEFDGPDPEPTHLEHGLHADGPQPEPDINPNVP